MPVPSRNLIRVFRCPLTESINTADCIDGQKRSRSDCISAIRCLHILHIRALFAHCILCFFFCFVFLLFFFVVVVFTIQNDSSKIFAVFFFIDRNEPGDFLQVCVCSQRSLGSVCASAQADQSLRCPPEDAWGPWLHIECPAKTLIRLRGCAGWSKSSLGAHAVL